MSSKKKNIKWASIIPLAGGMSIGMEQAIGHKPEFIISFPGFQANDAHLRNYWPDVPYHIIDENFDKGAVFKPGSIDIVNSVCPCAGLSMLNTGGNKNSGKARGSDAVQNQHMYNSSRYVLEHIQPKVLFGENAPGLITKIGEGVQAELYKIAEEFGYSFSIVKTSTKYHGIPQNRIRTFFFFWKADSAPILNYYDRTKETKNIVDYLKDIPADASYQDTNDVLREKMFKNYTFLFMRDKYGADNWREVMWKENSKTVWAHVCKNNLVEELKEFSYKINDRRGIKETEHAIKKFAAGLGIWDGSVHLFKDEINAVVGRNMADSIHPTEDRYMNAREYLHLMGHPHDYELTDIKWQHHLTQNVPTCTSRDWTYEVIKFIEGKLPFSGVRDLRQDNIKQCINTKGVNVENEFSSDFFA